MRLIDADKLLKNKQKTFREFVMADKVVSAVDIDDIVCAPTIDPETMRPTAHIMRGTVRDTYDNAFCSSCRSCLNGDEYFGEVLAHRYKYCPYCSARFVSADE